MDATTIAAAVGALLAPHLKKAADAFVGEAGEYVEEKARDLWRRLRARFEGDPPATDVLDRFEKDPDGHREEFETTITEKATADKSLSDDLAADVTEIKRKAPYLRVVQNMVDAENVVAARVKRVKSGTIDVDQRMEKVKGAIGAEIDDFG